MAASSVLDLVVIGGGTGGLVSALIAAGVGARVALVERDRLGGDCLWTGCVPSKSLLAAAHLADAMRHADRVGLAPHDPVVDLDRVMHHARDAQRIISPQDSAPRLRAAGVEVLTGAARFTGPGTVLAGGRELRFRKAILATGSRPVLPPVPGLTDLEPLTSDTVWELRRLPERLLVLGGGAVGCELGQGFARLGARVSIVEPGPRLIARESTGAATRLAEQLGEDGVDVRCGTSVSSVSADTDVAGAGRARLPSGEEIAFDRVLVCAGRRPRSEDLGLEVAGVASDAGGAVTVDARLRTGNRHVFAVGDVTGMSHLTHLAAHHARVATVNALFATRTRVERDAVPRVLFTDPEIAAVGAGEDSPRARDTARFDYAALDRAVAEGRARGEAVLVGDRRGRLIGASVVGPGAGESIAELTAWLSTGARMDRVSQVIHAYPTLAEGAARAADEHLRVRYARPAVRRVTRPLLRALAAIDRPR